MVEPGELALNDPPAAAEAGAVFSLAACDLACDPAAEAGDDEWDT
jgi:hypothetical protein